MSESFQQQIENLKDAKIARLNAELHPHTRCLNCGAKEPCNLDKEETSGMPPGEWPGSPCMFELTPRELWDRTQDQRKMLADRRELLRRIEAFLKEPVPCGHLHFGSPVNRPLCLECKVSDERRAKLAAEIAEILK